MQKTKTLFISEIEITLTKKPRQKHMYVKVCPPNGCVKVSAPPFITDAEIRSFVEQKMPKIKQWQKQIQAQQIQNEHNYITGEEILLFGKPITLQVVQSTNNKSRVKQFPTKIMLSVPKNSSKQLRERKINEWYKHKLMQEIERMHPNLQQKIGVHANEFRIKNMKTRWGTCNTKDARIWINLQLAKKPLECLEYVLVHELCHLIEPNHSKKFWALVKQHCPTYVDVKHKLDGKGNDN